MDTKALRQKILDLAIRGKLVPQDPNDEPASVLLERIREEKQQMLKEGKLKPKDVKNDTIIFRGEDNLHYEKFRDGTMKCIEDEIPFEVPEGWEWCRLGVLFNHNTGKALNKNNSTGTLLSYITTSNLYWNHFELDSIKGMYFSDTEIEKCTVNKGDLLVCEGGDIGRAAIWNYDYDIRIQNHIHKLRPFTNISVELYYHIFYYYKLCGMINGKGIGIQGLSSNQLHSIPMPLPSLSEQYRIVEKLNELLSFVDTIESNKTTLQDLIKQTKSKILDLAIRGKLVPQNLNDEPTSVLLERIRVEKEELIKQGKIKRDKKESIIFRGDDNSYYEKTSDSIFCINKEIPFEIPNTWEWMRLENCCIKEIRRGKSPKYANHSYTLVFAQKCNTKQSGIDTSLALYLDESTLSKYSDDEYLQDGDVVINSTGIGTLGRVGFYRSTDNCKNLPIVPDSHVTVIRTYLGIKKFYMYVFMKANQGEFEKKGEGSTNQKELKSITLREMLIPIPPYPEQRRIVVTVTEIFAIISVIEKSLI